jgi:hypothetical protein
MIGKNQLELLIALGSPTMSLVVPCKESNALVKRGLLRADGNGSFACITSAGLRALADDLDSGRVMGALENIKRDVARRQSPQPSKE